MFISGKRLERMQNFVCEDILRCLLQESSLQMRLWNETEVEGKIRLYQTIQNELQGNNRNLLSESNFM